MWSHQPRRHILSPEYTHWVIVPHPSSNSTCILVQLHIWQVSRRHLQRLQRYRANDILLTRQNKHTNTCHSQPLTWWSTVHTTRHIFRTTFWFVDTHTDRQTRWKQYQLSLSRLVNVIITLFILQYYSNMLHINKNTCTTTTLRHKVTGLPNITILLLTTWIKQNSRDFRWTLSDAERKSNH